MSAHIRARQVFKYLDGEWQWLYDPKDISHVLGCLYPRSQASDLAMATTGLMIKIVDHKFDEIWHTSNKFPWHSFAEYKKLEVRQ